MELNPPRTQKQEVLYCLLNNKAINVRQMMADTGILNIKARISDLRLKHHIAIKTEMVQTNNKFERLVTFGQWSITDKEQGIKSYIKMQQDEN